LKRKRPHCRFNFVKVHKQVEEEERDMGNRGYDAEVMRWGKAGVGTDAPWRGAVWGIVCHSFVMG
jgi:hypothetical protein